MLPIYRTVTYPQVQHEQSLHDESRIAGGAAHVFWGVYGCVVVAGPSPFNVVALTSTGIAAPVLREKTRCPRTLNKLAISPECAVTEM